LAYIMESAEKVFREAFPGYRFDAIKRHGSWGYEMEFVDLDRGLVVVEFGQKEMMALYAVPVVGIRKLLYMTGDYVDLVDIWEGRRSVVWS
jgi:hypothetical protein